LKEHEMIEMFR